jgi:hypothetical protein
MVDSQQDWDKHTELVLSPPLTQAVRVHSLICSVHLLKVGILIQTVVNTDRTGWPFLAFSMLDFRFGFTRFKRMWLLLLLLLFFLPLKIHGGFLFYPVKF